MGTLGRGTMCTEHTNGFVLLLSFDSSLCCPLGPETPQVPRHGLRNPNMSQKHSDKRARWKRRNRSQKGNVIVPIKRWLPGTSPCFSGFSCTTIEQNGRPLKSTQIIGVPKPEFFRVCLRAPFLPPFFPHFSISVFRPCSLSHHFSPLHLPFIPLF